VYDLFVSYTGFELEMYFILYMSLRLVHSLSMKYIRTIGLLQVLEVQSSLVYLNIVRKFIRPLDHTY